MKNRTALEILEEALHLLRSAPPAALLTYLAGSIPFVIAALFFAIDLMHSRFAAEHLLESSLALAVLFIAKNICQGYFMAALHRYLVHGGTSPSEPRKSAVRLVAIQAALQPLSLLAIPIGLILTLPFASILFFFRNLALYAALGRADPVETARKQAGAQVGQAWGVVALLTLAGALLFVNLLIVIALLPQLGRSFLGIEGDLARLGGGIVNVATLSVAGALTWLALDPLLDAVSVLRCFYGESVATGEDLRAALRRVLAAAPALFLTLALFSIPNAASAQVPVEPAQPSPQAIDAAEIDRSISTVIRRREFTWRERIPNKSDQARPPAWLTRLTEAVSSGWEWFKKKLRDWFRTERPNESGGKDAPVTPRLLQWMIGIAVVLVAGLLVAFFRRRQKKIVTAQAIAAAPAAVDLTDESVGADQLPESSWLALAQDWINQGDFRLALRALYLAGLSFLGQRRLISLRRWKCGLDYRRELERRTRAQPELAPLFARNVALFEQGWYGRHAVDRGTVEAFAAGLDQLRKHAG